MAHTVYIAHLCTSDAVDNAGHLAYMHLAYMPPVCSDYRASIRTCLFVCQSHQSSRIAATLLLYPFFCSSGAR